MVLESFRDNLMAGVHINTLTLRVDKLSSFSLIYRELNRISAIMSTQGAESNSTAQFMEWCERLIWHGYPQGELPSRRFQDLSIVEQAFLHARSRWTQPSNTDDLEPSDTDGLETLRQAAMGMPNTTGVDDYISTLKASITNELKAEGMEVEKSEDWERFFDKAAELAFGDDENDNTYASWQNYERDRITFLMELILQSARGDTEFWDMATELFEEACEIFGEKREESRGAGSPVLPTDSVAGEEDDTTPKGSEVTEGTGRPESKVSELTANYSRNSRRARSSSPSVSMVVSKLMPVLTMPREPYSVRCWNTGNTGWLMTDRQAVRMKGTDIRGWSQTEGLCIH